MTLSKGVSLKTAVGKNSNPFYQIDEIPEPVISSSATVTPVEQKETFLYDVPTRRGQVYTLEIQ
jgi:alpha-L-fucosidase 2